VAWFKSSEEQKTAGFLTELAALQRLEARRRESDIRLRVPTLLGIVAIDDGRQVIGTLTTAIRSKMLAECGWEERERNRARWREQIQESACILHSYGIV
jgi:hypothetical protein